MADHAVVTDVEPRFTLRHGVWLLIATLLAAALRLWQLGEWSFWIDEGHTWRDATLPLDGDLGFLSSDRGKYPVTFLLLRGLRTLGALGDDEFSLRLPFALLGVVSVPLLAFCGRRLVGPTAAVAAALLCAVHPWHIFWSQSARGYALVFLASVLVVDRITCWLQDGRSRDLVLALLALLFGIASHPTGVFTGLGVGLFLLLRPYAVDEGRRLLVAAGISVVVVVVASVLLVWLSPYQGFVEAKADPSPLHFLQTVAYYFRPALLIAGLVGLVLGGLRWSTLRGLLITCLLLAPLVILLAIGGSLVKATARYAYCTLPLWLLLAGKACVPWFSGLRGAVAERMLPAIVAAAIVGMDLLGETAAYHGPQYGQRARWREACTFAGDVARRREPGASLRIVTINQPSTVYYLQRDYWVTRGAGSTRDLDVQPLLKWSPSGRQGDRVLHEPGWRNHLRWQRAEAARLGEVLVVVVMLPELREIDPEDEGWRTLQEEFELSLHLPCWVGPKDESLYVFVPAEER